MSETPQASGSFTPQNELEEAMLAASERPELTPRFLEALRGSPVYIPQRDEPASGETERIVGAGEEVALPAFEQEGRKFIPIFSSLSQLDRGAPDATSYLRSEGATLATIWPDDAWLALNPGGELGTALPPEEVRRLAQGGLPGPATIPAGSEVMVGAPAGEPERLLDAVSAFARSRPEVLAAYRALVLVRAPGERPRIVIGLELEGGSDPDELLAAAAEAVGPSGEGAGFVAVDRERPTAVTGFMLEESEPIYRRS